MAGSYQAHLHLADRPAVPGQLLVSGEEGDALADGLSQQQPVEGIFVKQRQAIDVHGVLARDRQFDIAIIEEATAKQTRLDAEVFTPQSILDGDLPQAGGAEEELVARVIQELTRSGGKPRG